MAAFTLMEILLAIALIALFASVLIAGASHLLSEQPVTPDDVFWKSVQEARKAALKAEHEVRLKFDAEKKQFVIIDGFAAPVLGPDGITKIDVPLKTFPVAPPYAQDLEVEFLPAQKSGQVILVAGVVMETQKIKQVTFYSDGTCTGFRAQIARAGGAHTLAVDPWTCAPVLTPPDPNAPPPR